MRRSLAALAATFAALQVVALTAPAVVLAVAADKGGISGSHGLDLVVASVVVGTVHAAVTVGRLAGELRRRDHLDVAIAAFDALVVLALAATLLLIGVLGGLAQQHTVLLNEGWPILGLWLGVQAGAVVLAELVRTGVLGWLGREPRPGAEPAAGRGAPVGVGRR